MLEKRVKSDQVDRSKITRDFAAQCSMFSFSFNIPSVSFLKRKVA